MENKYYSEEIVKDTKLRQNYADTISAFLEKSKVNAEKKREKYITPEKLLANPEKYRADYKKMLGFPLNKAIKTPKLMKKVFVAKDKNINIYRMQLKVMGIKIYGLYFEQLDNNPNTPFTICLHGGGGTPELVASIHSNSANYNHLARRISDRGSNVFCPQLLLWNPDSYGNSYNRNDIDGKLRQLGGSITALEVYLMSCCISYFIENENANPNRIGCAGLSYGGMYTLYLSAYDTRIRSAYSCSYVNDCFDYSWPDWSYKDAQLKFTNAETGALIAPRAFVCAMGNKDELFKSEKTEKVAETISSYYKAYGAEDKFKCLIFEGVHETDKDDVELDFYFNNL